MDDFLSFLGFLGCILIVLAILFIGIGIGSKYRGLEIESGRHFGYGDGIYKCALVHGGTNAAD